MIFSNSPQIKNSRPIIYIDANNPNENDSKYHLIINQIHQYDKAPYIRFLGVYIDPSFSFQHHINTIHSKLSKTMYILRTVKNFLPEKALKSIYYSLFHCHLVYCLPIWSSASQANLNKIKIIQKKAIRILTNSTYNAHTEPLFKKTKILPFEKLILFFNLQIMHRYIQGFLPFVFRNIWLTNQERRRVGSNQDLQRILRNSDNLNIPFARLSTSLKHPYFNLPITWSNFDFPAIKIIRDIPEFNFKLKTHLLQLLSDTIHCTRLLCPVCHLRT